MSVRIGIAVTAGVVTGRELWKRRDREQIEALVGVIRRRPTLYRVTLHRQEPLVSIEGDHARIVGSHFDGFATGVRLMPRVVRE